MSDVLTITEVAKRLKLSVPTVRKAVIRQGLPAVRIGKQWRFRSADVERWLERQAGAR